MASIGSSDESDMKLTTAILSPFTEFVLMMASDMSFTDVIVSSL